MVVEGERAVMHLVEAGVPASDVPRLLAVYLEPGGVAGDRLVWMSPDGPRPLDPGLPIGEQVPAEAEVEILPEGIPELARPLHPDRFPPEGHPRRP